MLAGAWRYFGRAAVQGTFPPDWHANVYTGQQAPADRHWSRVGEFAFGDIKAIWEPSRFRAAFVLVRAWWRTGDERYAEAFWTLFESWRATSFDRRRYGAFRFRWLILQGRAPPPAGLAQPSSRRGGSPGQ